MALARKAPRRRFEMTATCPDCGTAVLAASCGARPAERDLEMLRRLALIVHRTKAHSQPEAGSFVPPAA